MTLKDMGTLLVKGTSVSDIKELQELSKANPEVIEIAKTGASLQDIKELITLAGPEPQGNDDPNPEPDESDRTPDYKKLYEDEQQKSKELEQKVLDIQKENSRKDNSGNQPKDEDILLDILKNSL